jgi:hypothetical protein
MADIVSGKEQNLRVLRAFRLNGEHIAAGSVIPKSDFGDDKGAWSELCIMTPQTCTQTDDAVSRLPAKAAPTKAAKSAAAMP